MDITNTISEYNIDKCQNLEFGAGGAGSYLPPQNGGTIPPPPTELPTELEIEENHDFSKSHSEAHSEIYEITTLGFWNITKWGPQAKRAISSSNISFWGVAEHHIPTPDIQSSKGKLMMDYKAIISPAIYTGNSENGTHGGTMALAKHSI